MVDVGYFIDGRHGVIRNVDERRLSSAFCEFENSDREKFIIQTKDIEYVIPHEEECTVNAEEVCKPYTEEQMIELCNKVHPPITNEEKFEEVFGFKPNKDEVDSLCNLYAPCDRIDCAECPIHKHARWDGEYKRVEND